MTATKPGTAAAAITRWVLILHAALLAAQPFLAGAMLDAMSPDPQTMHRMVAMTVVTVSIVQIVMALIVWKGQAAWPRDLVNWSLILCLLELGQFSLGHLSIGMSVHIPLGITVLAIGLFLAFRYARRSPAPAAA
ncbi:hypothetical protein [Leucobacter sp. G161]|uniref:hypothetical protein n=1 Tax=Leucobacter sp. G161 TaxID=663704 RepID=UPI00073C3DA7|nr:hypothetical protein [Leucobacter sp. G161]KUF06439.1 hypothetical protein AUL38_12890 [Leucobacter sp. G161]